MAALLAEVLWPLFRDDHRGGGDYVVKNNRLGVVVTWPLFKGAIIEGFHWIMHETGGFVYMNHTTLNFISVYS